MDPRRHQDEVHALFTSDPRIHAARPRKANLSPLMRAKAKNRDGTPVNFCPYGCGDEDLDSNGYCDHLIGFTNDPKKGFEPLTYDAAYGHRRIKPKTEKTRGGRTKVVLEKVEKTDKLVRITVDYRVYRDIEVERPPVLPDIDEDDATTLSAEELELERELAKEEAELAALEAAKKASQTTV